MIKPNFLYVLKLNLQLFIYTKNLQFLQKIKNLFFFDVQLTRTFDSSISPEL